MAKAAALPGTASANTIRVIPESTSTLGVGIVALFIVALLVPLVIQIGPLRLSFYRVVLLATFFPTVVQIFRNPSIRICSVDILVTAFTFYVALSFAVTGASVATIGIHIVETLGPYCLARAFIRSSEDFIRCARVFVLCIILTIPFALYENVTRDPIILTVLGKFLKVLPNVPHEQRFGLDRAQVVFDHPILYGLFSAGGFSFALYTWRLRSGTRPAFVVGALVGLAAFLSLSSAALVYVALQSGLFAYDRIMRAWRGRWAALLWSGGILYTVLELASNRSMAQISISFLAMNPGTAWTRLLVNEAAVEEIKKFPFFGAGLGYEWHPPSHVVTTSIDNFWLAVAFRNGYPSAALILAAALAALIVVGRVRQEDERVRACQTAFCITLASLSVSIFTVHLWNASYVLLFYLLGCALWVRDAPAAVATTASETEEADTGSRVQYTRFASRGNSRVLAGAPPVNRTQSSAASQPARPSNHAAPLRSTGRVPPIGD